ncbi:MAG: hypothetical protein HY431_02790 [Candidatus Levybacteria bacterium]|nr:hypothetical protein [Candidatus Levybacteria bacterium]
MMSEREPGFSRTTDVQELPLEPNGRRRDIWSHPGMRVGRVAAAGVVLFGTLWLAFRDSNPDNPEPVSPTATLISCDEGTPVHMNATEFLQSGQAYINEQTFEHDKIVFQEMVESTLNLTLPEEKRAGLVLATPDPNQDFELFNTKHEPVYGGEQVLCADDLNNPLLFTINDGYYVWSGYWFPDIQVHRWVDPKTKAPVQELWEFYYNQEGTRISADPRILGDNELTTEQKIGIGNKIFRYPPTEWRENTEFPQLNEIQGSIRMGNKEYVYRVISGVASMDVFYHYIEVSS